MIKTFLLDYPTKMTQLRRALARKDAATLASVAHALKGSVSIFDMAAPGSARRSSRIWAAKGG